jgi:hypothetical protein
MDMRKFSGETFIKADDVRDGPLEMQVAVVKEGRYGPDLVFESGELLGLNATNNRILMRAYGPNSEDWIGKKVQLTFGQVEYQKEMKDTVVVKPIDPPSEHRTPLPDEPPTGSNSQRSNRNPNDKIPF